MNRGDIQLIIVQTLNKLKSENALKKHFQNNVNADWAYELSVKLWRDNNDKNLNWSMKL